MTIKPGGVINEHIISTMPLGGDVRFSIEARARNYRRQDYFTGEFIMYPSTVRVAATTFNFTSDINRLILAPNGYAVVNGSNDYVIMATGIKKIVSPYYDAPGVLRAGRVTALGNIDGTSWGIKKCSCTRPNNATGRYHITHNIGHLDYFVNVTPASNGSWTKVHGAILEKTTTYVVVGMYDAGYENTTTNYAFEFMICGRN